MVMGNTAVTVVVPIYMGGAMARRAIQSLIDQTYEPVEVLVINDGSPMAEDHRLPEIFGGRIRYVEQENRGLCSTLNRAIFELVSTPLIARLDQDDWSAADRLMKQIALLEAEEANVCFCAVNKITERLRPLARHPDRLSTPVAYSPRQHGCIAHSTLLARTDFLRTLGGYDPELYPCDDLDLSIRISQRGKAMVHHEPLVSYLIHGASNTFPTFWQMEIKTKYLYRYIDVPDNRESFADWFEREGRHLASDRRERRLGHGRMYYRQAGLRIGTGRYLSGTAYLTAAFALNPKFFMTRFTGSLRFLARGGHDGRVA